MTPPPVTGPQGRPPEAAFGGQIGGGVTGRLPAGIKGCGIVFLAFPVTHALVQACFDAQMAEAAGVTFLVLGFGLLIGSLAIAYQPARAVMGLAAGFLLWAAVGEVPHHTGHGLHVGPDHWGVLLVVGASYLLLALRESSPRRAGVQIAWEFFLIVWALHVLLLTAYYDPRFGVRSPVTAAIFLGALASAALLGWRIRRIADLGQGIRAGVVVASLGWTAVEISMKWGWLPKPWKPMHPWVMVTCAALLVVWGGWPAVTGGTAPRRAGPQPPTR